MMVAEHYESTKANELYTSKCLILCYVNSIQIERREWQEEQFGDYYSSSPDVRYILQYFLYFQNILFTSLVYRHAHGTSFKKGQRGKGKCKSPSFPIFHSLGSLPLGEIIVPRFLGILSLCIGVCICVYRWLPTYDVSAYNFFSLWWCKSDLHSVETVLQIWVFDLFPGNCSSHSATWSWGETTNTLTIILSPRAIVFHFQYSIKQITFNWSVIFNMLL